MARVIQVFEYEKLTLHKDWQERFLTPTELEKLYDYNDKNGNKYFTGIRDGIRFKNFVGVIQIGGLTIEILPKTDRSKSGDDDYANWHSALLKMLRICKHISVTSMSESSLKKRHNSLLDLYFEMYLEEVEVLLRKGLIKQYRRESSNVKALKGRINFNKHIQQNLIHQERFHTTHQIYDYENLANQIILRGLLLLDTLTFNPALKDRIARLRINFPEIKEIQIHKFHFDKVRESRKTQPYSRSLQIAKMIILNYSPDIRSGQENMLTLLFDMNKLWEEYIYRMLLRTDLDGLRVSFQNKQEFWDNKTIRPDIVLQREFAGKAESFVIDTKWKVIEDSNPSDDDLKQIFAYNLYWGSRRSLLLYPGSYRGEEQFGTYHKGRHERPHEKGKDLDYDRTNQCKVGFINILDERGDLDFEIGNKIIEKLMP